MKTRGKGSAKTTAQGNDSAQSVQPKVQLGTESTNPPHVFILPVGASSEARIVTLQNPRYLTQSRYLICPNRGFYEISQITAPRTTPRSLLLAPSILEDNGRGSTSKEPSSKDLASPRGYVMKNANMFIATAIDPLFLILPVLCPLPGPKTELKKLFLSGEDYLDAMASHSPHIRNILQMEQTRRRIERRMAAVSDTVDGGDETMYRLNEDKLLGELLKKAEKMANSGLPMSMEEQLVRKALQQPTSNIPLEELGEEDDNVLPDTQSTSDTTTCSSSEVSTAVTSFSEPIDTITCPKTTSLPQSSAPDGITALLRLRTALLYICSAYITPHITQNLTKILTKSLRIDFTPLDEHLLHLTKLRQDAVAARSVGDYSLKRSLDDDDENDEKRAAKRRKEDEEKKRKANESRGVKALKKVNVAGMKKMSDFFKKT